MSLRRKRKTINTALKPGLTSNDRSRPLYQTKSKQKQPTHGGPSLPVQCLLVGPGSGRHIKSRLLNASCDQVKDHNPSVLSVHNFVRLIWAKTCQNGSVDFKDQTESKRDRSSQYGSSHIDSIQYRMDGRYRMEQMKQHICFGLLQTFN